MRHSELTPPGQRTEGRFRSSADASTVTVKLSGAIFGDQSVRLRSFLKALLRTHANKRWILHLDELEMISMRSLRVLRRFARLVHQRGCRVEIRTIQPHMQITLRDLKLEHLFSR